MPAKRKRSHRRPLDGDAPTVRRVRSRREEGYGFGKSLQKHDTRGTGLKVAAASGQLAQPVAVEQAKRRRGRGPCRRRCGRRATAALRLQEGESSLGESAARAAHRGLDPGAGGRQPLLPQRRRRAKAKERDKENRMCGGLAPRRRPNLATPHRGKEATARGRAESCARKGREVRHTGQSKSARAHGSAGSGCCLRGRGKRDAVRCCALVRHRGALAWQEPVAAVAPPRHWPKRLREQRCSRGSERRWGRKE